MFVRTTSTPNSPRKSVKIVESIRIGLKVKQVMLHHVGVGANEQEIEKLKQLGLEFIAQEELRRERNSNQCPLFEPEKTQKQKGPHQKKQTIFLKKKKQNNNKK